MIQNSAIREFQNTLAKLKLDAALMNTSEVTRSVNLRRLSGFTGSDAALLITHNEAHLFTDGRYKAQSRIECPQLRIHITKNKIKSIARIILSRNVDSVGLETARISYEFVSVLKKMCPRVRLDRLKPGELNVLRLRKTPDEVHKIRDAAHLASAACMEIISRGLSGKSESRVASELESLFREKGASGASFDTIVASGWRSALPHGTATSRIIEAGELVIIDYGCRFSDYCSDETVTCIVENAPSPEQKKIYESVREAHDRAIDSIRPGIRTREVDQMARQVIEKAGYGGNFLHSLGHGVGLEVHEAPYLSPRSAETLDIGMVFTIEPGVYIEGIGGVRLESLVHLTESGPEILSTAPKDLIRAT